MNVIKTPKNRTDYLRELLSEGHLSTQEELVLKLQKASFSVTQSTVSRDLRKLGAIRMVDTDGVSVYRLPSQEIKIPTLQGGSLAELVTSIKSNGSLIVVRTQPGSASLIARFIDMNFSDKILGTIAGDDTVFVAPESVKNTSYLLTVIMESLP